MSVDLVFRDISRAFDKARHDGLKYKLMTAQLPDTMTRILSNYLADRTPTVRIGDYLGQTFQLKSGYLKADAFLQLYSTYIRMT